MPTGTSGLERDLSLIRRRAWLFIPFAILGLLAAVFIGNLTGESTATASLTLDTTVHDLVVGGDRGLRIYEAQEMTSDPKFRDKVREAIGDPDFDFGRFAISLSPISVADGISRGILTISIIDPVKADAERYRQAFVNVFITEYTEQDGLWRTRFVDRRRKVAEENTLHFEDLFARLKARTDPLGIYLPPLIDVRGQVSPSTLDYEQQAQLRRELAEVEGAISAIARISDGAAAAVAGSVLGQPVAPGDAAAALAARQASLEAAIEAFSVDTVALAESKLDPETLRLLDELRGTRQTKDEAYARLANAEIAVGSAESYVTASYSSSGGLAGSMLGRVAVAIVVTIVFGLIAIYTVEWLSQARGTSDL